MFLLNIPYDKNAPFLASLSNLSDAFLKMLKTNCLPELKSTNIFTLILQNPDFTTGKKDFQQIIICLKKQ